MRRFAIPLILLLGFALPVFASDAPPLDSDGDGYSDEMEIANGYDPYGPGSLADADTDRDTLSNADELIYHTDMLNPDTDGDGYFDGDEVRNGFDPTVKNVRLGKRVVIDLSSQTLTRFYGPIELGSYQVSTGKPGYRTPTGSFAVNNKHPRAWSRSAKLWMPWWMSFIGSTYGLHELPEWPNGYKEGVNHLGRPVSHGCVRLGVGAAKEVYEWVEVGTPVVIKQ